MYGAFPYIASCFRMTLFLPPGACVRIYDPLTSCPVGGSPPEAGV